METKVNYLYLLTTKNRSYYVVAENPNNAIIKLKYLMDKANYDFGINRIAYDIKLIAKEINEFPPDKPNFSDRDYNNLILPETLKHI